MTPLKLLYQSLNYLRKCSFSSHKVNLYLFNLKSRRTCFILCDTITNSSKTNCWVPFLEFTPYSTQMVINNHLNAIKRYYNTSFLGKTLWFHPVYSLSVKISQQVKSYSSGTKQNSSKENKVTEILIDNFSSVEKENVSTTYRCVMRNVPQSIVLLTSAVFRTDSNSWLKRGVICSSLLSVSLKPPILSFCLNRPSRMHDLLEQSQHFAINILGKNQAKLIDLFSSPAQDGVDQFLGIPHHLSKEGLPVLPDTPVLLCQTHCVHNVGDHSVWYGMVTNTVHENKMIQPVLHFYGSYCNIGEKVPTIPRCVFTQSPTISHLEIAWQCIKNHGKKDSLPHMKEMIQKKFHSKEKDWHETIATFYLEKVSKAFKAEQTFEEFLKNNSTFLNINDQLLEYYSIKLISSPEAKEKYVVPDQKNLNDSH